MSKKDSKKSSVRSSTLAALLEEKPRRGRPRRAVSRQNVYVALSVENKQLMNDLAELLPADLSRADVPDLAISTLTTRLEAIRQAVVGRDREIPEGITDLDSLYLLWDLPLPLKGTDEKWTSIRVSPQQAIELGRIQGMLNAVFGATRSQTFALALALLEQFLATQNIENETLSLSEVRKKITQHYL